MQSTDLEPWIKNLANSLSRQQELEELVDDVSFLLKGHCVEELESSLGNLDDDFEPEVSGIEDEILQLLTPKSDTPSIFSNVITQCSLESDLSSLSLYDLFDSIDGDLDDLEAVKCDQHEEPRQLRDCNFDYTRLKREQVRVLLVSLNAKQIYDKVRESFEDVEAARREINRLTSIVSRIKKQKEEEELNENFQDLLKRDDLYSMELKSLERLMLHPEKFRDCDFEKATYFLSAKVKKKILKQVKKTRKKIRGNKDQKLDGQCHSANTRARKSLRKLIKQEVHKHFAEDVETGYRM
eukprot:snap_masked-scaffold_11-processed-gene-9.5-mRNA-1 protein AED:1.00 eAED:1.00 QI:0/0/0/0/1/1/2/0/295